MHEIFFHSKSAVVIHLYIDLLAFIYILALALRTTNQEHISSLFFICCFSIGKRRRKSGSKESTEKVVFTILSAKNCLSATFFRLQPVFFLSFFIVNGGDVDVDDKGGSGGGGGGGVGNSGGGIVVVVFWIYNLFVPLSSPSDLLCRVHISVTYKTHKHTHTHKRNLTKIH